MESLHVSWMLWNMVTIFGAMLENYGQADLKTPGRPND
jgi:hypothetical protein